MVRDFEDGYAPGITPNPCVRCNQRIKFGVLLERARAAGATHLATGHYARTGRQGLAGHAASGARLRRDQAYVLHRLDQHQLGSAVFALGGDESKAGVRAEAAALGLVTAAKPESQDLCFVDTDMKSELRSASPDASRPARSPTSTAPCSASTRAAVLHGRTACRASASHHAARRGAPRYVIELRPATNTVVVGPARRSAPSHRRGVLVPLGRRGGPRRLGPLPSAASRPREPHPARIEANDAEAVASASTPGRPGGARTVGGALPRRRGARRRRRPPRRLRPAAVPPTPGQVLLGILAVLAGCLAVTTSSVCRRVTPGTGSITSARSAAGVRGRRRRASGCSRAPRRSPGWARGGLDIDARPWDAGVSLPLIGIRVTPVAIVGLLVAAVGLSLVLLFERVPGTVRATLAPAGVAA